MEESYATKGNCCMYCTMDCLVFGGGEEERRMTEPRLEHEAKQE